LTQLPSHIFKGEIIKQHGGGTYHAKLEDGRQIYCFLVKKFKVRTKHGGTRSAKTRDVMLGEKVKIEVQLRDPQKGAIVGYC
jgi:translation initiation factor IF-1